MHLSARQSDNNLVHFRTHRKCETLCWLSATFDPGWHGFQRSGCPRRHDRYYIQVDVQKERRGVSERRFGPQQRWWVLGKWNLCVRWQQPESGRVHWRFLPEGLLRL